MAQKKCTKYPSMPVLLLAAGKGTRLAPITHTVPKCLVPIEGRPLLSYWLEQCAKANLSPVYVNTHYLAEQVESFLSASSWTENVVCFFEETLRGTGGTLLDCREQLAGGTFCVVHADNVSVFDMQAFIQAHEKRPAGCIITMMLFTTPTPQSCGIVELDTDGRVQAFHEKVVQPPGNLANGAVYIMEPEVFSLLEKCASPTPDISLDLLPQCLGRIATYYNGCYHRDIGTVESYTLAQQEFSVLQNALKNKLEARS